MITVKQTSTKRDAEDRVRKTKDKDLTIIELEASRTDSELLKALAAYKGKRLTLVVLGK